MEFTNKPTLSQLEKLCNTGWVRRTGKRRYSLAYLMFKLLPQYYFNFDKLYQYKDAIGHWGWYS